MKKVRWLMVSLLLLFASSMVAQQQGAQTPIRGLKEYLPAKPASTAVVVCPGGSYCWLSKKTEGSEVARFLNAHGMAAYVLEYPTAGWAAFAFHTRWFYRGHQYPDQLEALRQAMGYLKGRFAYIGAMGFSAGGHLVLSGAEFLPDSLAPDFVAALYPVVTFSQPCVHRRSRRGLLGERRWRNRQWCDSLSVEMHAERVRCPIFLANCKDDPIVHYHNAELMDSALTVHGKSHVFYQYPTGGHGFATTASKTSREAITWTDRFLEWICRLGF
jgi:acetyl esterase/lipase